MNAELTIRRIEHVLAVLNNNSVIEKNPFPLGPRVFCVVKSNFAVFLPSNYGGNRSC